MQKLLLTIGAAFISFAAPEVQARGLVYCVKSKDFPVPIVNRPGEYFSKWQDQSFTITRVEADDLTGDDFLDAYYSQNRETLSSTLTNDARNQRIRYNCNGSGTRYINGGYYAIIQFTFEDHSGQYTTIRAGFGTTARSALASAKKDHDGWGSTDGIENGFKVLDQGGF